MWTEKYHPRKAAHVSAAVVSAWGKEFDLDALLSEEHMEIETLRPEKVWGKEKKGYRFA